MLFITFLSLFFQGGAIAEGAAAYINIPGSQSTVYAGGTLSEDFTGTAALRDHTSGTVRATGQVFHVTVNTYDAAAAVLGFSLVYTQLPCAGTSTNSD